MKKLILAIALFVSASSLQAQNTGTGLPSFGSFTSGGFDTINNQNLNVLFSIPLVSSSGRGMPLNLSLTYNSVIYRDYLGMWYPLPVGKLGWFTPSAGYITYSTRTNSVKCTGYWATVTIYSNYAFTDIRGTVHSVPSINISNGGCTGNPWWGTFTGTASDDSGYYLDASTQYPNAVVTAPNGAKSLDPLHTMADTNGNYVTAAVVSSTETDWTDSVGNVASKEIYTPNQSTPTSIQFEFLDGNGNYQTITAKYQSYSIKTNFGCSGIIEHTATAYLPYELDIPSPVSGTLVYTFTYEQTPGLTGYYSGRLQQVTLPTGGYYKYTYNGINDGINCSDGTTMRMSRLVSDGTNSASWTFVRNASSQTTVTTPMLADTPNANDTVYTFNSAGAETQRKIYKESPGVNVLRTINTTWTTNGTPATKVTILEDGSTKSEVDTTIDSNGLLDSLTEYDWGMGAHGSTNPIRTTALTYQTSTNYTSRNILNLVTSKVIKDGSGTTQYRQDVTYDGVGLANCPTGVTQHDDTDYPCTMNYRGNPTAVTTYLTPATPANGITKNFTYDIFGNLLTAQLNCCQNKTWAYSATTKYSQPDSVTSGTSPTQLTTSATYNVYTGQVATVTDENNQVTTYSNDFLRRLTKVVRPDNTQITVAYDDVNFKTTSNTPIDSTHSIQQIAAADTLGRTLTTTTEDAANNVYSIVKNEYDLAGRSYGTSNPYTSSPSYWTTASFDVLGRTTKVTLPDSSASTYTYATNTATATDPTGIQRKSATDAAGRLSTVWEPDPTNNNSLSLQTSSTYNVLDELTQVSQISQTRAYVYDALGRLLSATTPESGMVCFGSVTGSTCNTDGYDNFDNLQKRTDARGVLTSYGYDGLNRLTGVSYNVTGTGVPPTPSVSLTYGTTQSSFNNGRLISMTDGVGSETYTYNNLGLMTELDKTISSTVYKTKYAYNLAYELTQITYPSGRVVQQSVDAIGRLCEIAPSTTGCGTASSPYATGYGYNAASQATGFKYGNGVYASFGFSSDRLQLNCLDYSTTNRNGTCAHDSTTKFGLSYSYGTAGSNNGQISGITDSVDNGRSAIYTYDALYRLTRAVTAGSSGYPAWGLSEAFDSYGNRTAQGVYSGCSGVTCPTNSVSVSTATNRITTAGYDYDLSGNMTNDGNNTLTYDAENRTTAAANGGNSGAYYYDGSSVRVKKTFIVGSTNTTTVYIFSGSKVIAEYDNGAVVGSPSREYIYSGAVLLAKIDSSGTKYYHQDHLSNRLVTDSSGNTFAQLGHFPFGESWYNAASDKLLFTSYERDAESGNDYAMARYNVSRLGRFSSPDPLSGDISNPQSLNHYPYAGNNPISFTDPTGMDLTGCDPTIDDNCAAGGGGDGGGGDAGPPDLGPPTPPPCDISTACGLNDPQQPLPPGCVGSTAGGGCTQVVADAPPDFPLFSSSFLNQVSISTTALTNPQILNSLLKLQRLLAKDPNCLAFLNGRAVSGTDALTTLGSIIDFGLYGSDLLPASATIGPNTIRMDIWNAQSGPSALAPHAAITVNAVGAFFAPSFMGIPNPVNNGTIPGGTPSAQNFLLLHELGHATNALDPDKGISKAGKLNDTNLQKNCSKTIKEGAK